MGDCALPIEGAALLIRAEFVGDEDAVADDIPIGGDSASGLAGRQVVRVVPGRAPVAGLFGLTLCPETDVGRVFGVRLDPMPPFSRNFKAGLMGMREFVVDGDADRLTLRF